MNLTALADDALLESTRRVLRQVNLAETDLLLHLGEVDARKLFREEAAPSMFVYCVEVLHFSENVAASRIEVARLLRRFPRLAEVLRSGAVHLTGLKLLARYFTEENCDELVALATGKSKAKIEELIVSRFDPKPLVPDSVRKLPTRAPPSSPAPRPASLMEGAPVPPRPESRVEVAPALTVPSTPVERRGKVEPLAPDAFEIRFTGDTELRDLVLQAKELLRHQNASGNLATIFKKSLRLLIDQVKKERFGVGARVRNNSGKGRSASAPHPSQERCSESAPRPSQEGCSELETSGRHIPMDIRRAVYSRDGGQCTYSTDAGRRCSARDFLEFDHVDGFALTLSHSVEGVRLRCRAHNQLAAEELYGRDFMERARQSARSVASPQAPIGDDDATALDASGRSPALQTCLF